MRAVRSYIREAGPVIAASYPVCAIHPGKKSPIGKNWNHRPLSPEECASYRYMAGDNVGVGIICGIGDDPVYGIDCDILGDEAASAEILAMIRVELGDEGLRYRVGSAPKFLVPVRGEAGRAKATSPWYEKDGLRSRIEVLGAGQQFVAFAIHPGTGCPYEWGGDMLTEWLDPPSCLPEATADKIAEILFKAGEILERHGWARSTGGAEVRGASAVASADELAPQYPIGITIETARGWLSDLEGKDDYDTWLKVGMALHHEFGARPEAGDALALWDDWSQGGRSYRGLHDLQYRWDGFGRRSSGGRCVTCRWLQYEHQKKHRKKDDELSVAGRAARLTSFYAGTLRYATDSDSWFRWAGLSWRRLCPAEILSLARDANDDLLRSDIERMAKDHAGDESWEKSAWKFYKSLQSCSKDDATIAAAKTDSALWVDEGAFDSDPRWVGVRNGVIDLEDLRLVKPEPSMGVSLQMGVAYDAAARCPLWEQTVSDVFFGDESLIRFFQKQVGYALTGNPTLEVMNLLYGNGSNGKSTLVNTLQRLFGDYACAASPDILTSIGASRSNAGGPRSDIVRLRHKRMVVISEIDQRARMQESVMKSLVSTDTLVARGMYAKQETQFRPTWVVFMLTNYLPQVDGGDTGTWRRLRVTPFSRNFETDPAARKDPNRAGKLLAELPGILNWVLEGVRMFREEGLDAPAAVTKETEEYKTESDVLQEWIELRCVVAPDAKVSTSIAYASWDAYARQTGLTHAINNKGRLTRELSRRGFSCRPLKTGKGRTERFYFGIGMNEGEEL